MDVGLDGSAALVTASSAGLGTASAPALAREGANVAICGRTEDRLDAAADEVDAAGELGDAVAFLSSERASYVNGAEVPIDGGTIRA